MREGDGFKMTPTAGDPLTDEEIRAMIEASKTAKDRGLISVLYESGSHRPGRRSGRRLLSRSSAHGAR